MIQQKERDVREILPKIKSQGEREFETLKHAIHFFNDLSWFNTESAKFFENIKKNLTASL